MTSSRVIPLFCASCSATAYDQPQGDEHLFQTKARLRESMGLNCPRRDNAKCPMRGERTPTQPVDFAR